MASLGEWFVGLSWLFNLILAAGAAYYSYRLTKLTGGFWAWWLIIDFNMVFVVKSFFSVSYGVVVSAAESNLSPSQADLVGDAYFNVVLNLLLSVLLFAAMFELHRTFKKVQAKQSP